ncbi:hypothetical protein M426DRAFT_240055 [Hypoxylon sp. CI-4A]|nr:hypothetical protein M426DRAFT_240055 [Hypoxylon sp. CI-4A]
MKLNCFAKKERTPNKIIECGYESQYTTRVFASLALRDRDLFWAQKQDAQTRSREEEEEEEEEEEALASNPSSPISCIELLHWMSSNATLPNLHTYSKQCNAMQCKRVILTVRGQPRRRRVPRVA